MKRTSSSRAGRLGLAALTALAAVMAVPAAGSAQQGAAQQQPPGPAPPPLANGVPDWRGVWMRLGSGSMDPDVATGTGPGSTQNPPFTPEGLKAYQEARQALVEGRSITDIGCGPSGSPRIMRTPYPMEVVVTPEQTWILSEFKSETRRIYTDGRPLPADDDLDYNFHGYSVGHWEGDTLVFTTVGLKAGTYDQQGLVHSDKLILQERMRRVNADILEDQITMIDPEVFARPWTVTRQYRLRPDMEIKEFYCENERNPIGPDGRTTTILQGND